MTAVGCLLPVGLCLSTERLVGSGWIGAFVKSATLAQPSEGRERVLLAAHELFVAHGYAEVSMQQIAGAAGITKATMYHHYPSKEALFLAVCLRETERMREGLDEIVGNERPFREQLEAIIRFLLDSAASVDTGRLFADLRRHVDHDHHRTMHRVGNPASTIRPLFERAIAAGEIQPLDLDVVVPMFFGIVFGTVRFAMDEGCSEHLAGDLAPFIARILIDGIGMSERSRPCPAMNQET